MLRIWGCSDSWHSFKMRESYFKNANALRNYKRLIQYINMSMMEIDNLRFVSLALIESFKIRMVKRLYKILKFKNILSYKGIQEKLIF